MAQRVLLLGHGSDFEAEVGVMCDIRMPVPYTIRDVRERRVLTVNMDRSVRPDLVKDLTVPVTEAEVRKLGGAFDFLVDACCGDEMWHSGDEGWRVGTFRNVERLTRPGGLLFSMFYADIVDRFGGESKTRAALNRFFSRGRLRLRALTQRQTREAILRINPTYPHDYRGIVLQRV